MSELFATIFILGKHERLGKDSPVNLLSEWELRQIRLECKKQLFYDEQKFLNDLCDDDYCIAW